MSGVTFTNALIWSRMFDMFCFKINKKLKSENVARLCLPWLLGWRSSNENGSYVYCLLHRKVKRTCKRTLSFNFLTCLTLFLDDETLNIPTVCIPNCSRWRIHIITTVGTHRLPNELDNRRPCIKKLLNRGRLVEHLKVSLYTNIKSLWITILIGLFNLCCDITMQDCLCKLNETNKLNIFS